MALVAIAVMMDEELVYAHQHRHAPVCEPMIEPPKPTRESLATAADRLPARLKRDDALKHKVGKIIKEHPKKTIGVLRRWLHESRS